MPRRHSKKHSSNDLRDLDVKPKDAGLRSLFVVHGKDGPPLIVWTFAEEVKFGNVLGGRFDNQGGKDRKLFVDRIEPGLVWVIDERGRLVGGTRGVVEPMLERQQSGTVSPAFEDFEKRVANVPADAILWSVASFKFRPTTDALPFLSEDGLIKTYGFHLSLRAESGRVVFKAHGDFADKGQSVACRNKLCQLADFRLGNVKLKWGLFLRKAVKDPEEEGGLAAESDFDRQLWTNICSEEDKLYAEDHARVHKALDARFLSDFKEGQQAINAKDYKKAVARLAECAKNFPEHREAQDEYLHAKKLLDQQQTFENNLFAAEEALKEHNLLAAEKHVTALKASLLANARSAEVVRQFAKAHDLLQFQKSMAECEAALVRDDWDKAKTHFEAARAVSMKDDKAPQMLAAVSWLIDVRRSLARLQEQVDGKELDKAPGGFGELCGLLVKNNGDDYPWSQRVYANVRSKLLKQAATSGEALAFTQLEAAAAVAKRGDNLAIEQKYDASTAAYENAKKGLAAAQTTLQGIEKLGKDRLEAADYSRVETRSKALIQSMKQLRGQRALKLGKLYLKGASLAANSMHEDMKLVPAVNKQARQAIKELQEAEKEGQPEALEFLAKAKDLQKRVKLLVRPLDVDFDKAALPEGWTGKPEQWKFNRDTNGRRWLIAQDQKFATLLTPFTPWPAEFILELQFKMRGGDDLWSQYKDPLRVSLLSQTPASKDFTIALGKDPTVKFDRLARLQVDTRSKSATAFLKDHSTHRLKIVCKKQAMEVFVNGQRFDSFGTIRGLCQLRLEISNPYNPTFSRCDGHVAIGNISVRAIGVDELMPAETDE